MRRPDIEAYLGAAMYGGHAVASSYGEIKNPRAEIVELCAYIKQLEMRRDADAMLLIGLQADKSVLQRILRDWLAACPETCGQCEGVRKRAEEAVR